MPGSAGQRGRPFPAAAAHFGSSSFPDSWSPPDAAWDYVQKDAWDYDRDAHELHDRNREWRDKMLESDPEYFTRMAKGQKPKYLWIGCADSRVAPENIVQAQPGEIFMHRNIANMVVATDANLRPIIQYAVDYLGIEHIVVCGHYDCGGVRAAATVHDHSAPLESWLTHIRDVARLHHDELMAIKDTEERHKRLVELNVVEQCLNLLKTGTVQKHRCYTGQRPHRFAYTVPRIHGMVYSPGEGLLKRLPINFREHMGKYKDVYGLYDTNTHMTSYAEPRN